MRIIPVADDHARSNPYVRLMSAYSAQLRSIPGFERCSRRELAALACSAERLDLPAGYTIVQHGDRWLGAIVVVDGEAIVETPGWALLLPAGARVERSTTTPSDITVRARTDLRVLAIQRRGPALPSPHPV